MSTNLPPVYVLGRFPPPYDGQTVLTEQAARLLEGHWSVTRISTSFQGEFHVETSGHWNSGKVLHYPKVLIRSRRALGRSPNAPVIWPAISPTLVGHIRDLLTVLPALRSGQKVYAVIHWGDFDRLFRSPLTRHTGRLLVKRLSGFVFNDGLGEKCAAWIPAEKRFTIPNTIDEAIRCTEQEVAEKQRQRASRKTLSVLYLSNMISSKGYFDVLCAIQRLHADGISVAANFIGRWQSEDERSNFQKYVAEHQLGDIVTAHGGVSDRAALKRFLLDADVFVLPTYYPAEAQPVSILEAINAGTAVVTTRHAGIPSMLREHAGEALFVSPRRPTEISESLRKLSDAGCWLTHSNAAVQRYRDHFSPEAVRSKWIAMLTQK